jgi:hypothetical protein
MRMVKGKGLWPRPGLEAWYSSLALMVHFRLALGRVLGGAKVWQVLSLECLSLPVYCHSPSGVPTALFS